MRERIDLADIILPPQAGRVSAQEKEALLAPSTPMDGSPHTESADFTPLESQLEPRAIDSHFASNRSLGLRELKIALLIVFAVLALCVPKIYLSSNIYYLSKDIASLQTQRDILLDENNSLKHEVETLRYKYLILEK